MYLQRTFKQTNTISAAKITSDTSHAYIMEDLVIKCELSNIFSQVSGVLWRPAVQTPNEFILTDGALDSETYSQQSTLTITATKLALLKSDQAMWRFTCEFMVDLYSDQKSIEATESVTILNPCKIFPDFIDFVVIII